MKETRPKVLALYGAVIELIDEGMDINAMTVSDITGRAGIGKGTAYEYFKSKEELIAAALIHDMKERMDEDYELIKSLHDFPERLEHTFDWIQKHFQKKKVFTRILLLFTQPCEANKALLEEIEKRKKDVGCLPETLEEMCREGMEQGEIREDIPVSAACMLVLGNIMAFVFCLERGTKEQDFSPEQMKAFLCAGLLESLGKK